VTLGRAPASFPDDRALADAARALEAGGFAAELWDAGWRLAYTTSEFRTIVSAGRQGTEIAGLGEHILSPAMSAIRESWPAGPTFDSFRVSLREWGSLLLGTSPGGQESLLEVADPRFTELLKEIAPGPPPSATTTRVDVKFGSETIGNDVLIVCLHDADGRRAGYALIAKPEMRASVLAMLALGDARLFERMSALLEPARRPAAILFADLEGSSLLARRLPTPAYFSVIRRLARGADRAVVNAGGIVGKHVGDGVTAFFLAEDAGSESVAARASIQAVRAVRDAARAVAERSRLDAADVTMRFGLHWGATLYVGRLMTSGRAEVTALGDEVNEAARIEACATGGRALASKALLERLDPADAETLDLDPAALSYKPLADLPTATEKARRDAPAIAVCEL
jgi:class 3 adenylate cyclase